MQASMQLRVFNAVLYRLILDFDTLTYCMCQTSRPVLSMTAPNALYGPAGHHGSSSPFPFFLFPVPRV